MRTVLIVDDELPARELLKMTIDWEEAGFHRILEARNGYEALLLYNEHNPDLVITDIQMPVMDGLELIRQIRLLDKHKKIIILSCHESFSYAKEALRLGVFDYLIKDALTAGTLYDTLLRAFPESMDKMDLSGISENLIQKDILRLVLEKGSDCQEAANLLQPYLDRGYEYFCLALKSENPKKIILNFVNEIAEELKVILLNFGGGEFYMADSNVLIILALVSKNISRLNMVNQQFTFIQNIRSLLERYTGNRITAGVSNSSSDAVNICQLANQARYALECFVFLGKGRTIYYESVKNQAQTAQFEILNIRLEKIKSAVETGDQDTLRKEISGLYKKDLQGMMQYNYLQHINNVLLGMLTSFCSKMKIPYSFVFGSDIISVDITNEFETVNEMCEWFSERFNNLLSEMYNTENRLSHPKVKRILDYIEKHFSSDLSLETIADIFNMHKVYLSRIFKNATGKTVNEYVREVRIQHAKKLLEDTYLTVNEIAAMTGFNTPQTFYNIFHQSEGISPGKYREIHGRK